MDCRQPGLSVHGILQARIREWVAISFSRGSFQSRDRTCVFRIGRWILYHGTTWKAQQRNSQAVGGHLFIINTWKLGEVSLVCGWCWWLQWIFLKIFLSSLWHVVPTGKTKRAIKQKKGSLHRTGLRLPSCGCLDLQSSADKNKCTHSFLRYMKTVGRELIIHWRPSCCRRKAWGPEDEMTSWHFLLVNLMGNFDISTMHSQLSNEDWVSPRLDRYEIWGEIKELDMEQQTGSK